MEATFLQIGKKPVFPELIKDPAYGLHVWLAWVFSIDQNVVQIHNDEDVELVSSFSARLVDIALEAGRSAGKSKRHDLVLEVTVSGPKGGLTLIAFSNSHPVVGTGQVQLGKTLGPTEAVKGLTYQGQRYQFLMVRLLRPG